MSDDTVRGDAARRLFALMTEQTAEFDELSVLLAMAKYAQWRRAVHLHMSRKLTEILHVTDAAFERELAAYFHEAAETLARTVGGVDLAERGRKPSLRIVRNPIEPRRRRVRIR